MDGRRTARINLRLDPVTNALLRQAAALEGKTLTAFLLDAARERGERAIERHHPPAHVNGVAGPAAERRAHVDV